MKDKKKEITYLENQLRVVPKIQLQTSITKVGSENSITDFCYKTAPKCDSIAPLFHTVILLFC